MIKRKRHCENCGTSFICYGICEDEGRLSKVSDCFCLKCILRHKFVRKNGRTKKIFPPEFCYKDPSEPWRQVI